MRVQAKSVSPQNSQLGPQSSFASVALSAKILQIFAALSTQTVVSIYNIWPKAVIKGRPQGLLVALCPCRPSSTCSPSVLPKLKQIPTGLSECALLVPSRLGEHRAVVSRSLFVPSELLSEDYGVHSKRSNCVF